MARLNSLCSSRRRQTSGACVAGVRTCALPISPDRRSMVEPGAVAGDAHVEIAATLAVGQLAGRFTRRPGRRIPPARPVLDKIRESGGCRGLLGHRLLIMFILIGSNRGR